MLSSGPSNMNSFVTQSRKLLFFTWIYIYIFVGQLRHLLVFKIFPSAGYMMRTVENVFYSHTHTKIMYPIMPTVLLEGNDKKFLLCSY